MSINESGGSAAGTKLGVPSVCNHHGIAERIYPVSPSSINYLRIRPQVLTEHVESSREVQGTVQSGTIVGQVFKHNQTNINGLGLTMRSLASTTAIDAIEYADDATLQAAWVSGDSNRKAVLDAAIKSSGYSSTKSMKLDTHDLNDWTYTKPADSWDFTAKSIEFDIRQSAPVSDLVLLMKISDGANESSIQITVNAVNSWETKSIPIESFSGNADITAITKLIFEVTDRSLSNDVWIDNIYFRAQGGSVTLKLWDMGDTLPVSGVTALDDGTQYTTLGDAGWMALLSSIEVPLESGKRQYKISDFIAGTAQEIPANVELTAGNYYAVTIHYVDTNVEIYGPNTAFNTNYYQNGYAFTVADESSAISAVGQYSDLQFLIFSAVDVYIHELEVLNFTSNVLTRPHPKTSALINAEGPDMEILNLLTWASGLDDHTKHDVDPAIFLPKGGKFEVNMSFDPAETTDICVQKIHYWYQKPDING